MPELDIELVRVQAEREAGGRGPDIRGGERGQAGPGAAAGAAPRRSADSPSPDTTQHNITVQVRARETWTSPS